MTGLRQRVDAWRPWFRSRPALRYARPLFDAAERMLLPPAATTPGAPHVRDRVSAQRLDAGTLLASLPAAAAGAWLADAGPAAMALLLVAAAVTAAAWEWLFAVVRGRPYGHGVFLAAWLFWLLAPTALAPWQAVAAMSFGFVFGRAVFGGAGRHIVNPALLALVFALVAYPDTAGSAPAAVAPPAAAAAGGLVLVLTRTVAWRIVLGGIAGVAGGSLVTAGTWAGPLFADGTLFVLVFIATDPAAAPLTNAGRWAHGLLAGALTCLLDAGGVPGFEAACYAVLFASLLAPLVDHAVVEAAVWRRRRRLARGPA